MKFIILLVLASLTNVVCADVLPDKKLTPGATNPQVTQENIESTICVKGWTKTIRPPVSYTNGLKRQQIIARGLPGTLKDYEEDHLIPLELGGAPSDEKNLWPEPWDGDFGAHEKDVLENQLHRMVCTHKMSLKDAQRAFADNWIESYQRYTPK